jgi:hypothetical protein
VTLWAGDMGDDGQPELLVGAKSGAIRVLDAVTGEPEGMSTPTGSPVVRFLEADGLILAAHTDSVVELISLAR